MKVVYVDWRDRQYPPEIVEVYEDDAEGYQAKKEKEDKLKQEGYDTDDEVHVRIEEIEIHRKKSTECTIITSMGAAKGMIQVEENGDITVSSEQFDKQRLSTDSLIKTFCIYR